MTFNMIIFAQSTHILYHTEAFFKTETLETPDFHFEICSRTK